MVVLVVLRYGTVEAFVKFFALRRKLKAVTDHLGDIGC